MREVVDDINTVRPVAYTTVMTVTNILHTKGWLLRAKQGRAWLYTPVRSREAYAAALMEDGLGASKDRPAALVHFVENMTDDEVTALREALRSVDRKSVDRDDGHRKAEGRPTEGRQAPDRQTEDRQAEDQETEGRETGT